MITFKEYIEEEHGAGEWGTNKLTKKYKKETPGQECSCQKDDIKEYAVDAKGHKSSTGGLTQKGVDAYNRENPGHHLQTAVTTKPSKLKPGSKAANRRKSFCARMSGVVEHSKGDAPRAKASLKRWKCPGW